MSWYGKLIFLKLHFAIQLLKLKQRNLKSEYFYVERTFVFKPHGDHGLSIQPAPCRVDPVPESASGPARYPMSASTVVWTSPVWGSARSPNPASNKSVMVRPFSC